MNDVAEELKEKAEELNRPAEIQLITITDASCEECFDITTVINTIKTANVKITSEENKEYTEETAQALIEKYNIEKIPTVIVTGEINKEGSEISGLEEESDALIFTNLAPVYLELPSGEYRGRVQIQHIINPECEDCYDLSTFIEAISDLLSVSSEETIERDNADTLIEKYNLTELPAIIISGDLDLYPETASKLGVLGTTVEEDLVLTAKLNPPYWDLEEEKEVGLVSVTYITDDSCEDCYNVSIHKTVLKNYGVFIAEETTVDIASAEGQALKEKYALTKVPTIIASEDLKYYEGIDKVWDQVGTIENDGNYVFRELDLVSKQYTTLE